MSVLAAHRWRDNGELIADVAKLGYLSGRVLDPTYGLGKFWTKYRPAGLVASDIDPVKSPIGRSVDITAPHTEPNGIPLEWVAGFDAVVVDPPYKLNGRPDPAVDERYGVATRTTLADRMVTLLDIISAAADCVAAGGHLLVKCQAQVCSGRVVWQDDLVTRHVEDTGDFVKVDRFDLLGHHRPQPMAGRRQRHAHGRPSTLLVFQETHPQHLRGGPQ